MWKFVHMMLCSLLFICYISIFISKIFLSWKKSKNTFQYLWIYLVFCHFDTSLISQYIMTHKMFLTGRLANTHTVCVWVGLCLGLRGVTSKCRDPRELVPGGVPVVWSLHISHIPRYAGLITLASSAAPWLPLCTDSCWPPSTNILLLLPQST